MSSDRIKKVCEQIVQRHAAVRGKGEEATKQALILPFIDALGYDIWNPDEVCPEYDADFAVKKAGQKEKVDIAIVVNGTPRIYIEVKTIDASLDGHEGQLARYFNATQSVTLGVLTNGIEWRFFTDTGNPNVMDHHPFHMAKLDSVDVGLDILARFCKPVFSPEAIRDYATELFYTAKIADFLKSELDLRDKDPSEYFIRWILKSEGMYEGMVNSNVVDRFKSISKNGLTRVIREIVRRSVSALDEQVASTQPAQVQVPVDPEKKIETPIAPETQRSSIVTTEEELRFFALVKEQFDRSNFSKEQIYDATQRKLVAIELAYKDTTGYFGIYFNKPSWWIIRGVLDARTKWVGFNIPAEVGRANIPSGMVSLEPSPWSEFRVEVKTPEDIVKLSSLVYLTFQGAIQERARNVSNPAPEAGE